jgi:hypothetical protein
MSHLALVSIALGTILIAARGPMLLAPAGTLGTYRSLIQSNARVRVLGVFGLLLGLAAIAAASGSEGTGAWVIWVWGWLALVVCALFVVPLASAYRRVAEAFLGSLENSNLTRTLGAVNIAIGALLVYLGLCVF